jgi:error-prone DNA polymerase
VADPFVHLHVASGYSLQYGASHPHVLVERAAEQDMDTLALTDRDGTYGAVRFVKAAMAARIRPILGVDLAFSGTPGTPMGPMVEEARGTRAVSKPSTTGKPRTPTRGGASRDPRLPRVTFLASGKAGWAAVCRLVSATHQAGERGTPVCTPELVAEHVAGHQVRVLLGPASELGGAATLRRDDLGGAVLRRWLDLVGPEQLVVEVVSHRLPGSGPGSSPHAARMAGLANSARVRTVLSNAVRFADRLDAPTVDILDATRRLVPMDVRHLDRSNAEGFIKSGKEMHDVAEEICRYAGLTRESRGATELLAQTRTLADQCVLDPRTDLGIGEVHFPEFEISSVALPGGGAPSSWRARGSGAFGGSVDGTGPPERRIAGSPRKGKRSAFAWGETCGGVVGRPGASRRPSSATRAAPWLTATTPATTPGTARSSTSTWTRSSPRWRSVTAPSSPMSR